MSKLKARVKKNIKGYILLTLGSFITALSINIFLVPNKIAPGGVSGLATVLYYLFDIKVGILMLVLNIPLFLFGIKYLGGTFGLKTLYATIILSLFVDNTLFLPVITQDILLASIYGGVVMGIGLGIVFYAGATTGGTDLAAKITHGFFPSFSIGQLMLIFDALVILFAALVFNDYDFALYATITLYISAKIIDTIIEGVNFAKALIIVSDKSKIIADKIISDMGRGVTSLKGQGIYTGDRKDVLLCVVRKGQIPIAKNLIHTIDDNAFVIVTDVREVLGEGFSYNK